MIHFKNELIVMVSIWLLITITQERLKISETMITNKSN